jgi:hypothetical protein
LPITTFSMLAMIFFAVGVTCDMCFPDPLEGAELAELAQ